MKILVMSDTHGKRTRVFNIIKEHRDADALFYLGDGEADLELGLIENGIDGNADGSMRVFQVCGNCDRDSKEEVTIKTTQGGVPFLLTHGFDQSVEYGTKRLVEQAKEKGCQVALYGHIHKQCLEEEDGVITYNPGAVLNGEYGLIYIENGQLRFEHKKIEG